MVGDVTPTGTAWTVGFTMLGSLMKYAAFIYLLIVELEKSKLCYVMYKVTLWVSSQYVGL